MTQLCYEGGSQIMKVTRNAGNYHHRVAIEVTCLDSIKSDKSIQQSNILPSLVQFSASPSFRPGGFISESRSTHCSAEGRWSASLCQSFGKKSRSSQLPTESRDGRGSLPRRPWVFQHLQLCLTSSMLFHSNRIIGLYMVYDFPGHHGIMIDNQIILNAMTWCSILLSGDLWLNPKRTWDLIFRHLGNDRNVPRISPGSQPST